VWLLTLLLLPAVHTCPPAPSHAPAALLLLLLLLLLDCRHTGKVVGAEASAGVDSVKGAAQHVAERVSDAVTPSSATDHHLSGRHHSTHQESEQGAADDAKQSAHDAASKLQEGMDAVAHGAGYAVGTGAEAVDEARDAAARASAQGESACVWAGSFVRGGLLGMRIYHLA
jgi:hypothetical protein